MNTKHGLIRLWLALSVPWIGFCGYEIYAHDHSYKGNLELAKVEMELIQSERALMIQNYVFDQKALVESMNKAGVAMQFDEAKAKDEGYSRAVKAQEDNETRRTLNQAYEDAYDHQAQRTAYMWRLPALPIIAGLLFLVVPWVIRGFSKQ